MFRQVVLGHPAADGPLSGPPTQLLPQAVVEDACIEERGKRIRKSFDVRSAHSVRTA